MPQPKLIELVGQVREDLDRHFESKPAQLQDALINLLLTITTAEVAEDLATLGDTGDVRGLSTHLDRLARFLADSPGLPQALCAHYLYNRSEPVVKERCAISDMEWDYIHDLAREAELPIDIYYRHSDTAPFNLYRWHDPLEEEMAFLDVCLDRRALDDMLLATLEGYLSPLRTPGKHFRKGREVCGFNLGMVSVRSEETRGKGWTATRYVHVMRSEPQLSAEGAMGYVDVSDKSLEVLLDAAKDLFPQYEIVGDFHSHPYDDFDELVGAELVGTGGWRYSSADEEESVSQMQELESMDERPWVAFVVAIARGKESAQRGHYRDHENTLQFCAAGCRIVIGAYRILASGRYSTKNLELRIMGGA